MTAPVLALRALGLGDTLTAVPALRGLRRAFPGRPLLLAGADAGAYLLRSLGVVDGVLPTATLDGPPPGRGLGRHIAVNLHGRGPQSHRLLQAGRPEALHAFACPQAGAGGPRWDEAEHEVLRWCRLVTGLGGRCGPADLRLGPAWQWPAPAGDRLVLIHPGAAGAARRWPVERYAAVARALREAGWRVAVTGSGPEREACTRLVALAGLPPGRNLGGRLGLAALARLVRGSALLVCGDTGVAHLATALGVRSVLLFGPTPPARWGPLLDPSRHQVLWHGRAPGDPHAPEPDPDLLRIQVQEVLAAATVLLDGGPAGQDRGAARRGAVPA